jgi:hypothetical protein
LIKPADATNRLYGEENLNETALDTPVKPNNRPFAFTAVSVLPIYSQEAQQSDKAQVVQSSEAQASEIINTKSPEKTRSIRKVGSSRPGTDQSTTQGYTFPTKRERFNRYVKSTVGPVSLAGSGVSAGIDQWGDHPVEWGQGAGGYGKRYASRVGRTAIQQTVTYGLDTALRLDTGFKRSDRKGVFPRMKDALAGYITSRTRSESE